MELIGTRDFHRVLDALSDESSSSGGSGKSTTVTGVRNEKLMDSREIKDEMISRSAIDLLEKQTRIHSKINACTTIMEYNRKLISYEEACTRLNLRNKPKYRDHNLSMIEDLKIAHANPAKELIGLLANWLKLENSIRQLFVLDPSETKEFYEECFMYIVDIDCKYSFEKTSSRIGLTVLNSIESPQEVGSCWGRCTIL